MKIQDVKTIMLTDEPVKWNNGISDGLYRVTACCMKLTGSNKQAKTEPFYYSLILEHYEKPRGFCMYDVLLEEVERIRGGAADA